MFPLFDVYAYVFVFPAREGELDLELSTNATAFSLEYWMN